MKIFVLTLIAICMLASPALAKGTPEDRIKELEQQISSLQKTYMTNNQDIVSSVSKMESVRDEFAVLKGQVEANSHLIKAQREEINRLVNDLQTRVQTIEDRMSVFTGQATSAISKTNPQAGAEAETYQRAMDLASSSKYLEAASAFESFLQKYPKSQFAPAAKYWVGESFYLARDLKRSIKEFQNFIEKYPKDPKVKNAVLKQGHAFYEMQMMDEARAFYEKVASAYPNTVEGKQAKDKIAKIDARKGIVAKGSKAVPEATAPQTVGDSITAYPTETIEQKRQKMTAPKPEVTEEGTTKNSRPGLPSRDF